jgi:hypothetical protein
VLAGTIGTKGGPVTDATAAVLTEAGPPIQGLYAAGNAAAFWTGDAYPAPGATLGIAMTMGYIAGRHAAGQPVALQETFSILGKSFLAAAGYYCRVESWRPPSRWAVLGASRNGHRAVPVRQLCLTTSGGQH